MPHAVYHIAYTCLQRRKEAVLGLPQLGGGSLLKATNGMWMECQICEADAQTYWANGASDIVPAQPSVLFLSWVN